MSEKKRGNHTPMQKNKGNQQTLPIDDTLNINDYNSPIKRHRLTEWMQKTESILFPYMKKKTKQHQKNPTYFNIKSRHYLRLKGMEKIFKQIYLRRKLEQPIWYMIKEISNQN